jgi:hypothetical protein
MSKPGRRETQTVGERIRRAQDAFRCKNQVIHICCGTSFATGGIRSGQQIYLPMQHRDYFMPRHRGIYKPDNPEPYELSRSAVEKMIRCEACFWLEKTKGVKTPSMPGFNRNTNTDMLLKKDFDAVRGAGPNLLMKAAGLRHLRPFSHPHIEHWMDSLHFGASNRFHYDDPATSIRFGGGLDDVWEDMTIGGLHIQRFPRDCESEVKSRSSRFLTPIGRTP